MMRLFIGLCLSIQVLASPVQVLFLGDSLTAGYQLAKYDAYPAIIQSKLGTANVNIINAAVSGDTTFSLQHRLNWIIKHHIIDWAVICIGANDGLRGTHPDIISNNLNRIIQHLKDHQIQVALIGVPLPDNYTKAYRDAFQEVFKTQAEAHRIPYLTNLLKGVAGKKNLNLSDGIHPNVQGHHVIAKHVLEFINPLIHVQNNSVD